RAKFANPVEDGGKIGRGVIACAIGLPDDERLLFEARMFGMKNHQRAFAFLGDPRLLQILIHLIDLVAVKAFTELVIKAQAESVVNLVERLGTQLRDPLPKSEVLRITLLELDQLL